MLTTSFNDLTIAEAFGVSAIKNTCNNLFKEFKNNYKYLTELYMVYNWKIWQHYEKKNNELVKFYTKKWDDLYAYVCEHFTKEQLHYFYKITD